MTPLFHKLNLKTQTEILVLDAPASFEPELDALAATGVGVRRESSPDEPIHFALAFADRQEVVDAVSWRFVRQAEGDAVLWFAYPKQSSRRYRCDFNRDTGWNVLQGAGFDTVRAVAIDDDWSALRFRRNAYIKPARRSVA